MDLVLALPLFLEPISEPALDVLVFFIDFCFMDLSSCCCWVWYPWIYLSPKSVFELVLTLSNVFEKSCDFLPGFTFVGFAFGTEAAFKLGAFCEVWAFAFGFPRASEVASAFFYAFAGDSWNLSLPKACSRWSWSNEGPLFDLLGELLLATGL